MVYVSVLVYEHVYLHYVGRMPEYLYYSLQSAVHHNDYTPFGRRQYVFCSINELERIICLKKCATASALARIYTLSSVTRIASGLRNTHQVSA